MHTTWRGGETEIWQINGTKFAELCSTSVWVWSSHGFVFDGYGCPRVCCWNLSCITLEITHVCLSFTVWASVFWICWYCLDSGDLCVWLLQGERGPPGPRGPPGTKGCPGIRGQKVEYGSVTLRTVTSSFTHTSAKFWKAQFVWWGQKLPKTEPTSRTEKKCQTRLCSVLQRALLNRVTEQHVKIFWLCVTLSRVAPQITKLAWLQRSVAAAEIVQSNSCGGEAAP